MLPTPAPAPDSRPHPAARSRGFTLIEVMIAVAIVGILTSLAYPSYRDHLIRGRLVDATNGLSTVQAQMERHFQDNRTYATVGTAPNQFVTPCASTDTATRRFGDFLVSCVGTPTATAFTLEAVGSNRVNGFTYRLTHANVRSTHAAPSGWNTCASQWLTRKGQTC